MTLQFEFSKMEMGAKDELGEGGRSYQEQELRAMDKELQKIQYEENKMGWGNNWEVAKG